MDFAGFVLNTVLSFLASTIKNPKSIAKYGKIVCVVRDGFNTLCNALQPPTAVGAKLGASAKAVGVDEILTAQRDLAGIK
jgi:hypothetical protein